jgi:hypothetical protein
VNPTTISHRLSLLQRPASAAKEAAWAFLVPLDIPEPELSGDIEAEWKHGSRWLVLTFEANRVDAHFSDDEEGGGGGSCIHCPHPIGYHAVRNYASCSCKDCPCPGYEDAGTEEDISPARVVELVGWVRGANNA